MTKDKKGLSVRHYLKGDQNNIRTLLAMALRTNQEVPIYVLHALANLIHPDPSPWSAEARTLDFRFRSRGNRRNFRRRSEVGEFIRSQVDQGEKVEAAIALVKQKFSIGRAEAFRIWTHYRQVSGALDAYERSFNSDKQS